MPTTKETIEWVYQFHYEHPHDAICERCGADWPCVPTRLAEALVDNEVVIDELETALKDAKGTDNGSTRPSS